MRVGGGNHTTGQLPHPPSLPCGVVPVGGGGAPAAASRPSLPRQTRTPASTAARTVGGAATEVQVRRCPWGGSAILLNRTLPVLIDRIRILPVLPALEGWAVAAAAASVVLLGHPCRRPAMVVAAVAKEVEEEEAVDRCTSCTNGSSATARPPMPAVRSSPPRRVQTIARWPCASPSSASSWKAWGLCTHLLSFFCSSWVLLLL